MTKQEFHEAIYNVRKDKSRISIAARMVLVDGVGILQAARNMKIDRAGVSRLVQQIRDSVAISTVPDVPAVPNTPD